jgi:hypothetical protein
MTNAEKYHLPKAQMPGIVSDNPKLAKSRLFPPARSHGDAIRPGRCCILKNAGGLFDRTAAFE